MLKNVFSRLARGLERTKSGRRRGSVPLAASMQIEQLEPRQVMTGIVTTAAPSTPVFSETYFIGSTVTLAVPAADSSTTNTLEVDLPVPVGYTLRLTNDMNDANPANDTTVFRVVQSTTLLGNGNTRLTLTQTFPANLGIDVGDKVSWLRPWQQSFDRTTQTLWFSNEDGARIGQLDPATGQLNLYDISLPVAGTATATDPHGAFFDLSSHITPRVWVVQRNAFDSDTPEVDVGDAQNSRVSYLDLATKELVSVDLASFIDPALIKETHAAFVDARGHLWITAEKAGTLIELDFDQVFDGTFNSSINSRELGESLMGRAIVHDIPFAASIKPHGLGTIIDERTGEPYIYFTDGEGGSGGIFLLVPGSESSGFVDRWFQWDMSDVLTAEGRPAGISRGRALFLAVDDHETPGQPEDDTLFLADPRRNLVSTFGSMREIQPQALIRAIQTGDSIPASSTVRTVQVPVINGPATSFSSPQLPFADREGNAFFVDSLGSVGRFHFDDPNVTLVDDVGGETSIPANILEATTTATLFALTLTAESSPLTQYTIDLEPIDSAGSADLSVGDAIDQYTASKPNQYFINNGNGSFRGAINAANVLYGSIAQSDHISTTVFAETARRQMSVVADPTTLPTGARVEGRMAFQVARNGSLIMTSRGHGQLLDQQTNLSRTRILAGFTGADTPEDVLIDGDSSSATVTNANSPDFGDVHVFGKNQNGGLVEYRFDYGTSVWSTALFSAPATGVLAGEPTAFIDEQGRVGALINRHDGHLLLYRNDSPTPIDLTDLSGGPNVFASVDIVEDTDANTLFAYGSNQAGDVVEYAFTTTTATLTAANVRGNTITVTTRPAGQMQRDTQIFQGLNAMFTGGTRHIFGSDGHSRLVHLEITNPDALSGITAFGENVTELTKTTATGYFDTFQQGTDQEFAARVYPELSVLVDPTDNTLFVYGTNGLDLVEFTRSGTSWTAANLTNDIMKGVGDRIPANKVFGAPGAYVTTAGDRHVFQINVDGDVVEYAFRKTAAGGHFNTQNINLARGNTYSSLQNINLNVAPTLSIPNLPLDVIAGNPAVLVAPGASVSDANTTDFATGQLIVRTINGTTTDVLGIRSQTLADGNAIAAAAGIVSFNNTPFGTFTGGTNSPLIISFTGATNQDALEALLQSVEFTAPIASAIGVRFVAFELIDDDGAISNRVAQQVTVDDNNPLTSPLIRPLL